MYSVQFSVPASTGSTITLLWWQLARRSPPVSDGIINRFAPCVERARHAAGVVLLSLVIERRTGPMAGPRRERPCRQQRSGSSENVTLSSPLRHRQSTAHDAISSALILLLCAGGLNGPDTYKHCSIYLPRNTRMDHVVVNAEIMPDIKNY